MKKLAPVFLVLATLAVLGTGWLDHEVGEEVHLFVLHLAPIGLVTWYLGQTEGVVIAALSVLVWLVGSGTFNQHAAIVFWNSISTAAVFFGLNALLSRLKDTVEEARMAAETDTLTGISNRRGFWRAAEAELRRSARYGTPLTVCYLDLDNFKSVNDTYGHPTGDALLTLVAQTMQHTVREVDVVARLGGDEFALLLPHTSRAAAQGVAEKVHDVLIEAMARYQWPVTVSVGFTTYDPPSGPKTVDELLRSADIAMYQAKAHGKNSVHADGDEVFVHTALN